MASTSAAPAAPVTTRKAKPSAARRFAGSAAAIRDQRGKAIQLVLFAAGGVLMPFGLLAIGLGWYGTAHSRYDYDQRTYLISGGVMGLGLAFVGGFLYFGGWLARIAIDQREDSRRLTEAVTSLTQLLAASQNAPAAGPSTAVDADELVLAGSGTTLHRRGCPLIGDRDDLVAYTGYPLAPTVCRVCRPSLT